MSHWIGEFEIVHVVGIVKGKSLTTGRELPPQPSGYFIRAMHPVQKCMAALPLSMEEPDDAEHVANYLIESGIKTGQDVLDIVQVQGSGYLAARMEEALKGAI